MTDQQPYTPSKHLVGYAYVRTNAIKAPDHELWDEYHRFIAQVEAAAEQRGKAQGWDQAVHHISMVESAKEFQRYFLENPHRADQLGAQDG